MKRQIDELAASIATMKEGFDTVKAEKEEKRKRKQEKQERLKREEEERLAAEEARQAVTCKAKRKEEKKRKEEERRKALRKEMLMEISLHMGKLGESLQVSYERETKVREKGKASVVESPLTDEDDAESYDSDVDTLSRQTEHLGISEKHKRSADKPVGDSPPMVTPAKRMTKRRLQLGCRHQQMKKTSPRRTLLSGRRKIPAAPGSVGKLKFVTENLKRLGDLNVEELKRICVSEDVRYDGKKMQAIIAITEKRTLMVYGDEEKQELEEVEGVVGEQVDKDEEGDAAYEV
ncbi:hypothetical protein CBR_g40867 [Chara braunii]|uniref:Uncharacterized protein n=1 Tax=Chara braunii TaxID=69332 RepID=A0A388K2B4_CHABU|nr:hypothetical protein CBR_g40867 [Chara braunii]|eukprot:GBG64167.1 hypothetical protein CBR_g40867 [Chara braunii]